MAADFITMATRITTELRRANLLAEAKQAINDAIDEASKTRFYLNEVKGLTFNTVVNQEFYSDLGLVEIDRDALYYVQGGTRYNICVVSDAELNRLADGNVTSGQLQAFSRKGTFLRLYPVPTSVVAVYVDGYGKLTPTPLAADGDTNNWMTYGERYIRQLAKAILWREVIRDYGEATVAEALAEDRKNELLSETTTRFTTDTITATQW